MYMILCEIGPSFAFYSCKYFLNLKIICVLLCGRNLFGLKQINYLNKVWKCGAISIEILLEACLL